MRVFGWGCLAKKIRKCQQFPLLWWYHLLLSHPGPNNDGTELTNNVHFSRLWRPPVTCKISHSQLLQCFLGIVLFPTAACQMCRPGLKNGKHENGEIGSNKCGEQWFQASIQSLIILISLFPVYSRPKLHSTHRVLSHQDTWISVCFSDVLVSCDTIMNITRRGGAPGTCAWSEAASGRGQARARGNFVVGRSGEFRLATTRPRVSVVWIHP